MTEQIELTYSHPLDDFETWYSCWVSKQNFSHCIAELNGLGYVVSVKNPNTQGEQNVRPPF